MNLDSSDMESTALKHLHMHFIAYARAQQGRYEEAKQAALDMVENVGDADLRMPHSIGFSGRQKSLGCQG
jgi:hypothetical protein